MKRLDEIKVGKRLSDEEMKKIVGGQIFCFRWKSSADSQTITATYFSPGSSDYFRQVMLLNGLNKKERRVCRKK